ncbi:MAG: gliding motility-associated C-terminal domain-containing protein, partial [Bacteroidetes bacterium]|nr:gliding motility-associated C-terminal domain-containing protein [Bacteroidota bacterium]
LGGGGGSGHANNGTATGSTNGGGMVIIKTGAIIGNYYSILANGNDNLTVAGQDGAGGAGSGGTVLLATKSFCTLNVSVNGGRGGYQDYSCCGGNPHGPGGGGGGGGVIWSSSSFTGINASFTGGTEGLATNNSGTKVQFGATAGMSGDTLTGLVLQGSNGLPSCYTNLVVTITQDTSICLGSSTSITSSGASAYIWSPTTGLNIATGATVIASPTTTTTYSVVGTNGCESDTATVTITVISSLSPTISGNTSLCTGDTTTLTVSGGTTYSWNTGDTTTSVTVYPAISTTYFVSASIGSCSGSTSITVTVNCTDVSITEPPCGAIYVPNVFAPPNAFTPNEDNQNEQICVYGNCIENMELFIYNRWGEKVFESIDQKICWNGTYKGKLENTAVFVYDLKATLKTGEKINKKGNISLLR